MGPVFSAASCAECHLAPILGGSSQIVEKRAGFFDGTTFREHPGGSLIQDRASDPRLLELVMPAHTNVMAFRATISVLGDGFVEAIVDDTLKAIQRDCRTTSAPATATSRTADRRAALEEPREAAGLPVVTLITTTATTVTTEFRDRRVRRG